MIIVNKTCLNTKSLTDLITHAGISSQNVSKLSFIESDTKFMVDDWEGLAWTVGYTEHEGGTKYTVRFCGDESVLDTIEDVCGKVGISTVELLLHELEHVRQMSLDLDEKWSDERLEMEACKAETRARG